MFRFDAVLTTKKHPEIATDPLNGCGISQIFLGCLEYIFTIPTK